MSDSEDSVNDFIDEDDDSEQSESDRTGKKRKASKKNKKGNKKHKEKKIKKNIFVEEEASEDDEDEEDGDSAMDEKEAAMAREARERLEKEYRRKNKDPEFLRMENEENLNDYFREKRAQQFADEDNELALQPKTDDPRIYSVACREGFEREACLKVYNNYFEKLGTKEQFQIFSATAVEKIKGYIYIEAFSNKHVYLAVADISEVNNRKVKLVELHDRPQIYAGIEKTSQNFKVGQWVRISGKGIYQGDLAYVDVVDVDRQRCAVRLAPRLAEPDAGLEDGDEKTETFRTKSGFFLKKAKDPKYRPPQKLFVETDYQEVKEIDVYSKNGFRYNGDKFLDGLLVREFPFKQLSTSDVKPTIEETKFFTAGKEGNDILESLIDQNDIKIKKFFKGDKVRIFKGELANLKAEVVGIRDSILIVRPILQESFPDTIEIPPSDCVKDFAKNDYVRVIEGKSAGKEGFIMKIEDETATLLCDGFKTQVKAFVNDLIYSTKNTRNIKVNSTSSNTELSSYNRFDLVKLTDLKTVAIVLSVKSNKLEVLDNTGLMRNINNLQIESRVNTRNFMAKNDKKQTFKIGDSVRVLKGKYGGSTGIIKHIYNEVVFIHNDDMTHTLGCCVEKVNNCYLLTANYSDHNKTGKGKDELLGLECAIIKGAWKGYHGICRSGNEKTVRLELISRCRQIDIERDAVVAVKDLGKEVQANRDTNRALDPKTPMIRQSINSPFHSMNSPGWRGFESPSYESKL